jgi:hypothetical protein
MRRWLLGVAAPEVVRQSMRAWGKVLRSGRAEMKFAPARGLDFFRPHGWVPAVTRSCIVEARRLGREMHHAWAFHALAWVSPKFRRKLEGLVAYAVLQPSHVQDPVP